MKLKDISVKQVGDSVSPSYKAYVNYYANGNRHFNGKEGKTTSPFFRMFGMDAYVDDLGNAMVSSGRCSFYGRDIDCTEHTLFNVSELPLGSLFISVYLVIDLTSPSNQNVSFEMAYSQGDYVDRRTGSSIIGNSGGISRVLFAHFKVADDKLDVDSSYSTPIIGYVQYRDSVKNLNGEDTIDDMPVSSLFDKSRAYYTDRARVTHNIVDYPPKNGGFILAKGEKIFLLNAYYLNVFRRTYGNSLEDWVTNPYVRDDPNNEAKDIITDRVSVQGIDLLANNIYAYEIGLSQKEGATAGVKLTLSIVRFSEQDGRKAYMTKTMTYGDLCRTIIRVKGKNTYPRFYYEYKVSSLSITTSHSGEQPNLGINDALGRAMGNFGSSCGDSFFVGMNTLYAFNNQNFCKETTTFTPKSDGSEYWGYSNSNNHSASDVINPIFSFQCQMGSLIIANNSVTLVGNRQGFQTSNNINVYNTMTVTYSTEVLMESSDGNALDSSSEDCYYLYIRPIYKIDA